MEVRLKICYFVLQMCHFVYIIIVRTFSLIHLCIKNKIIHISLQKLHADLSVEKKRSTTLQALVDTHIFDMSAVWREMKLLGEQHQARWDQYSNRIAELQATADREKARGDDLNRLVYSFV